MQKKEIGHWENKGPVRVDELLRSGQGFMGVEAGNFRNSFIEPGSSVSSAGAQR